jgi:hypothetical protein
MCGKPGEIRQISTFSIPYTVLCVRMQLLNWFLLQTLQRFVLNYKSLPYETVYVPYPDISSLWQKFGLSPLNDGPNMPTTTLPVISVASQDNGPPTVIADSFNIAL